MSASYDETIYDFFCHHFGKSFTLYYVDPLVKGIFGGSLKELSMRACFGDIYEIGEKSASLILGFLKKKKEKRNAPYSFLGGMQQLPLALSAKLSENIFLNWDVETIKFDEGLIKIRSQNGQTIECTHLFSTLPAPVLKLKGINICELDDIKFRKIKVFTFCYNKKLSIPEGFGYLVPQMEKEKILGVVFDSSLFDFPKTQLTVMAEEGVMQFEALDALKRHLYISHSPLHIVEHEQKLPQYTLGHLERVKTIEEKAFQLYPNFKILGNSFFGVSINDLILYSKKIAYDFS
jgi:oxygen-dependent protoporphyrinogen oxidase